MESYIGKVSDSVLCDTGLVHAITHTTVPPRLVFTVLGKHRESLTKCSLTYIGRLLIQ